MIVVTVNSGSTSIKLAAFETAAATDIRRIAHEQRSTDGAQPAAILSGFLANLPAKPEAVAHRVVHGGTRFTGPVTIDDSVLAAIAELSELAPLHNPKACEWIKVAREVAGPPVIHIAAFDTSFFSRLPRVAGEYALAARYGVDHGVRRYGFHGLAHEALWARWSELNPDLPQGGRVITLQLGGGCSAAAIERGRPLDTTMGFSPLEGLVMATRSGDVDPAVVPYLQRRLAMTSDEVIELLNRESGVSGLSGGQTDLGRLAADPAPQSQFAVDLYCARIRKVIGGYLTVLKGCDGIVFGGGVGEHVPAVRERVLGGLEWAGIALDIAANQRATDPETRIDDPRHPVRLYVIPAEEEGILVQAAWSVLKPK